MAIPAAVYSIIMFITAGIFISFFLIGYFIGYFDSWMISSAFYVFYFILWIYGFLGALQGQMKLIPLLGEQFQKIFKNIE